MNKKLLSTVVLMAGVVVTTKNTLARPEYVAPTGASGCTDCHLDDLGTGYLPGVLEAAKGGLPGLKEFLHPTPVSDTNTKPQLHSIKQQWDVTVGSAPLSIPLMVSDAEDDTFGITVTPANQSPATQGASFSQERTDIETNLPTVDFKWSPTAAQANKTYVVNFTAQEKSADHKLRSNTVTATITVWPARKSATNNISQFKVQRAQWSNNALNLAGAVVFKNSLTANQRKAAVKALAIKMRSNSGFTIDPSWHLSVDSQGNWKKTLSLPADSVPCVIKLEYEGLNATSTVKLAPKKTCLQ